MTTTFDTHGYLIIPDLVPRADCASLVEHMFRLREQGKLQRDDQCPISEAVYGDTLLDGLLERVKGTIAERVGRELLPTYSYARIYWRGEKLKRHVDRAACEISATLTLGFDADRVWPIYFARDARDAFGKAFDLDVGTGAVYKGCELPHWRTQFTGNWQAQVFLHFVDANGPHASEHLDRRRQLGTNAAR